MNLEVELLLAVLDHPHLDAIRHLRSSILASDPAITEHVLEDSPCFRSEGQDRITLRLRPGRTFQVLLLRDDVGGRPPDLDDVGHLVDWVSPRLGVIDLSDEPGGIDLPSVVGLVNQWLSTTTRT